MVDQDYMVYSPTWTPPIFCDENIEEVSFRSCTSMTSSTDFTLQIEIIQGCQMEEDKGPIGCDAHSSFESGRQRPNERISTGVHCG